MSTLRRILVVCPSLLRRFFIDGVLAWIGLCCATLSHAEPPVFESQMIFQPESWHVHASSIVELPNGDLLACWFHGSGERTADDVKVEGARLKKGSSRWSERFLMAETPGYPDCNPTMFIDASGRLWLLWAAILSNQWESAIVRYQIAEDFLGEGPPHWVRSDLLLLAPPPEFQKATLDYLDHSEREMLASPPDGETSEKLVERFEARRVLARDRLHQRLGWMPRNHPVVLEGKRIIVPLYSDGLDFSIMAISDDGGGTWHPSAPLFGSGNIQASIVKRRDGSLYAMMRNNGPGRHRLLQSESRDRGETWSPVVDSIIANPGSAAEVIALRNGRWVLVCNDSDLERNRLTVFMSEDEGKTWKWRRVLEEIPSGPVVGRVHYPSVIETSDGWIHVTYSHHTRDSNVSKRRGEAKVIKYVRFNEAWVVGAASQVRD
jgi:predicted neuraminidase